MPKAHNKRSHRSAHHGRNYRFKFTFVHFAALIIVFGLIIAWWLTTTTNAAFPFAQSYSVPGKPTISADFINRVLAHYQSPAAGKGQALYDDGIKYGIDPVYALAFFMHESSFGTTGVATVTHSLGNIRATAGYQIYKGYRMYHTWEEGFEDWYQLIAKQYVTQWGSTTVDQIVPVYAPGSDHNDVAG